jgi:hypothetical protein
LTGFDRFSTSRSDGSPIGSHTATENHKETVAMTTTHRISTTALLVVSLAAASAPIAGARPADFAPAGKHAPAAVYSRQDKSIVPSTAPTTTASIAQASAPPPIVRVQATAGGFDWGDAGIGAAGGLALSMIGLGGALAVSENRARRARGTTGLPS